MSETKGPSTEPMWNAQPEEEEVRRLLAEAGPRPPVSESEVAEIEAWARDEWRRRFGVPRRPRTPRWPWMLAAAAALLAGAGLVWRARTPKPGSAAGPAASLERHSGTVRIAPRGETPVKLSGSGAAARPIAPESRLETGRDEAPGRVALRMAGGSSVRLDAGTRAVVVSATRLEIEQGAVYIDTGAGTRAEEITVHTWAGLFRPTGTQFEVRVEPGSSSARLRVREGTVSLGRAGEDASAGAGEELTLRADGSLARGVVPVAGPEWDWVLQAAPMLDIEGIKVKVFLDWVARETGWRVEYADPKAASLAESTVLHGSITHLTPAESLGVVLASCGLDHRLSDGTLAIFLAGAMR